MIKYDANFVDNSVNVYPTQYSKNMQTFSTLFLAPLVD